MFDMESDNYDFGNRVATYKKYILIKMTNAMQNAFLINWNSLELRGQWGTRISHWIRMHVSIS